MGVKREGGGREGSEVDLAVYKVDKVLDTAEWQELIGNDKTDARFVYFPPPAVCALC